MNLRATDTSALGAACKTFFFSPLLLYVHRDRTDYVERGAEDVHLDSHTAPELCCRAVAKVISIVAAYKLNPCDAERK